MEKQKEVLRILLKNYTKISYKGGIAKVIFDDCFEDIAEEIVNLFAIPDVSKRSELLVCCANCKGETPIGCANTKCKDYSEFVPTH